MVKVAILLPRGRSIVKLFGLLAPFHIGELLGEAPNLSPRGEGGFAIGKNYGLIPISDIIDHDPNHDEGFEIGAKCR
jgi:hypothetical protein